MTRKKDLVESFKYVLPIFRVIMNINSKKAIFTNANLIKEINKELVVQRKKRYTLTKCQLPYFLIWQKDYYCFKRKAKSCVEFIFVKLTKEQRSAYNSAILLMYN